MAIGGPLPARVLRDRALFGNLAFDIQYFDIRAFDVLAALSSEMKENSDSLLEFLEKAK